MHREDQLDPELCPVCRCLLDPRSARSLPICQRGSHRAALVTERRELIERAEQAEGRLRAVTEAAMSFENAFSNYSDARGNWVVSGTRFVILKHRLTRLRFVLFEEECNNDST